MKINSIRNYSQSYNQNGKVQNQPKKSNNPSFGGALAINFWDAIARGGFAASFTVQDMTGTNFPRTYQALNRNRDITGEYNYKAASEVMIREFLTGPSMCLIPMAILAVSKNTAGTANSVPLENIEVFSDQMKEILKNKKITRTDLEAVEMAPQAFSQSAKFDFYERMFALALGEDIEPGKKVSRSATELAELLEKYDGAPKRGFFKQLLNKNIIKTTNDGTDVPLGGAIKAKDQIFNDIVEKFTFVKKQRTDDFSGLMTTDMNGILPKKNKISSLIKDFSNFGNDVQKVMTKHVTDNGAITSVPFESKSFMEDFKVARTGSKFITNVLMVALTGLFMMKIPKLYTRHKTNPETDAFRNTEGEVVRANK